MNTVDMNTDAVFSDPVYMPPSAPAPNTVYARTLAQFDQLLNREVYRLRARERVVHDELQGLYISDERIEQLLAQPSASHGHRDPTDDLTARLVQLPTWTRLSERLSLNRFERATLLLALAPEIDLKYETLYGYLNNDVTRKWPTRELALRLFTPADESPVQYRHLLSPHTPLFESGILRPTASTPERPAWLANGFTIDPTVAHFLLGARDPASYLSTPFRFSQRPVLWSDVPILPTLRAAMQRVPSAIACPIDRDDRPTAPLVILEGRPGSCRAHAVQALAHALGVGVLHLDLAAIRQPVDRLTELFAAAALHQLLYGSVLLIDGLDTLLNTETAAHPSISRAFGQLLEDSCELVFVTTEPDVHRPITTPHRTISLRFEIPAASDRAQLWSSEASLYDTTLSSDLASALADRFALTPGQIHTAFRGAVDHLTLTDPRTAQPNPLSDPNIPLETALFESARAQTRAAVGSLAIKAPTLHSWSDLVLPDAALRQVREVAAAIKHRALVYDDWGFANRLARGRGLTVLFSGTSGTGKTMAAAIIAKELGVDLYTIDLSSIVSKYIGETEKNLDRVFRAAHQSNAILFFDEADALFGKRSEVKDAHDRYANIEVAYLLQKMEEHEGAVILATNLSRNIDQAFTRRLQYIVEFPVPSEYHRERLWHGMFPPNTPLGEDVDFPFLAKQFEIAGGDIRNVALDAAFLAAQNGRMVTMQHLVTAMARQVRKQGRTPSPTDFKHYFALIPRD